MSNLAEALKEFNGLEYYEPASVSKTRKTKFCDVCGCEIPKGSSHYGARFSGEDGDWPVFVVCNACEKEPKNDMNLIKQHKRD